MQRNQHIGYCCHGERCTFTKMLVLYTFLFSSYQSRHNRTGGQAPQFGLIGRPHNSSAYRVLLAHESGMDALQTENFEDDERNRPYRDVEREVRHVVLRRPVFHVNHYHFDSLRQKLAIPTAARQHKLIIHTRRVSTNNPVNPRTLHVSFTFCISSGFRILK